MNAGAKCPRFLAMSQLKEEGHSLHYIEFYNYYLETDGPIDARKVGIFCIDSTSKGDDIE